VRKGTLFGALLGALAITATPALADQSAPTWNCRASLLQVFGETPEPRLEPLVANGNSTDGSDRAFCADDNAGMPELKSPAQSPLNVTAQEPMAVTTIDPDTAAARDQKATAGTKSHDVAVSTPGGELTISARQIQSSATASCVNGVAKLDGASMVTDLKVNGQALPLGDNEMGQITQQVSDSPLGGIITVRVNQKIATADSLTVQAVRVELFSASGSTQGTIVLGASKVARTGDTCAPAAPASGTSTATGTGTAGANGANGANGTSSTTPAPAPAPAAPTGGSGDVVVKKVVINGRNGGCGHVHAYIDKVTMLDKLPGRPLRATLRFGQRAVIKGKLISCSGKPIGGARLEQLHVIGHGFGTNAKTGVKTRDSGRFTLILQSNMSTRDVVIAYRPNLNSKRVGSRARLHFRVVDRHGRVMYGRPPHHPA
jgi:hypothetical protein